jgi:hypothetical protein
LLRCAARRLTNAQHSRLECRSISPPADQAWSGPREACLRPHWPRCCIHPALDQRQLAALCVALARPSKRPVSGPLSCAGCADSCAGPWLEACLCCALRACIYGRKHKQYQYSTAFSIGCAKPLIRFPKPVNPPRQTSGSTTAILGGDRAVKRTFVLIHTIYRSSSIARTKPNPHEKKKLRMPRQRQSALKGGPLTASLRSTCADTGPRATTPSELPPGSGVCRGQADLQQSEKLSH